VSSLELVAVGPSHNEITVESITSWVTTAESITVEVIDILGLEKPLEENGEDGDGVRLGANSSVVITNCGVRNVALVVWGVEVLAIPTRGEVHLGSEGSAVTGGETWVFSVGSIEAHDGDCLLAKIVVVLSASGGVTSNHSETIGEGEWYKALITAGFAGCIITSSLLVVHGRVAPCN